MQENVMADFMFTLLHWAVNLSVFAILALVVKMAVRIERIERLLKSENGRKP